MHGMPPIARFRLGAALRDQVAEFGDETSHVLAGVKGHDDGCLLRTRVVAPRAPDDETETYVTSSVMRRVDAEVVF